MLNAASTKKIIKLVFIFFWKKIRKPVLKNKLFAEKYYIISVWWELLNMLQTTLVQVMQPIQQLKSCEKFTLSQFLFCYFAWPRWLCAWIQSCTRRLSMHQTLTNSKLFSTNFWISSAILRFGLQNAWQTCWSSFSWDVEVPDSAMNGATTWTLWTETDGDCLVSDLPAPSSAEAIFN